MSRELLHAATEYAKAGFPVFPCESRGADLKKPIGLLAPNGHLDATVDPARISEFWTKRPDALIGLPMQLSHRIAFDCDPRHGGPASLNEFKENFGSVPDTAKQDTPGGGFHLILAAPDDLGEVPANLGPGIDIKYRGYIIVPPSSTYQWDGIYGDHRELLHCAPLPDNLRRAMNVLRVSPSGGYSTKLDFSQPVPVGARHTTFFRLSCSLEARGFSEQTAFNTCRQVKETVPSSDRAIRKIVHATYKWCRRKSGKFASPKFDDLRKLARSLRDLGFSREQARTILLEAPTC